jgi:hypothetical protein
MAQAAHQASPRRPTSPLLLFFFPRGADIRGPPISLPFPPFLSSSSRHPTEPAPPRDPRRARPPPHLPFLSPQPIKAIKPPVINWDRYFPSLNSSRDGRGHQWQAAGHPVLSPLRLLPCALFKLAHEPLRLPLPLQHTNTRARAPISPRRRLGFPPPPSIRRRR